tara:strand:+ start:392 stop:547 length:156 start_codon:yes stop_codon:yes gene_type:complete
MPNVSWKNVIFNRLGDVPFLSKSPRAILIGKNQQIFKNFFIFEKYGQKPIE